MVRIGFLEEYCINEVIAYIDKYHITLNKTMERYNGYQFLDVSSPALRNRSLCCWGKMDEAYIEERMEYESYFYRNNKNKDIILRNIRNELLNTRKLMITDAEFWIHFTIDFVSKYHSIVLNRYYDDVLDTVPISLIKIKLNEFSQDDLFRLGVNQMILIHS